MDTLTHGLAGLAFAALRKPTPDPDTNRAVWWGAGLAAVLPDIDVLYRPDSVLNNIRHHRGFTHSFVGAFLLTAVLTLVLRLFFRQMKVRTVFLWSYGSMLFGHLFFDWITGFGTRLLLPFSNARFGAHWVQIIDPYLTLPLLAGAVLWLLGRPRRNPRAAIHAALAVCLLYLGARGVTQQVLLARLHAIHPPAVSRVTVTPTVLHPFRWEWVVEREQYIHLGDVDAPWLGLTGRPFRTHSLVTKEPADAVVEAAHANRDVADFVSFARHPHITYEPIIGDYYKVRVTDYRGGYMFYFFALVDLDHNIRGVFENEADLYRTAGQ